LTVNFYSIFLFELKSLDNRIYCEVNENWKAEYFNIQVLNACLIILLPTIIIFICNSVIIFKIKKNLNQNKGKAPTIIVTDASGVSHNEANEINDTSLDNFYFVENNKLKRITHLKNNSKQITKLFVIISFLYALLSFPYLLAWLIFFHQVVILEVEFIENFNYVFAFLQISEIIYILNFCVEFYIYYFSILKYSVINSSIPVIYSFFLKINIFHLKI